MKFELRVWVCSCVGREMLVGFSVLGLEMR